MDAFAVTVVKGLPREARLEDLSSWLTAERLADVGLRRLRPDMIGPLGVLDERTLVVTVTMPMREGRDGAAGLILEASDNGSSRWARVTAQAVGPTGRAERRESWALARAVGEAIRTSLEGTRTPQRRGHPR